MDEQQTTSSPNTTPAAPMPEASHRTVMGVLSYLGILVLIPIIMAKDDPFVKFHIKQGLVVFIAYILVWFVLGSFLWNMPMMALLLQLINLGLLVLVILGIVNVVQGKQKDLPLVGTLAHSIPL